MAIENFPNDSPNFQDFGSEIDSINFNLLFIETFGNDRIEELKTRLKTEGDPIERAAYLFEIDLIKSYLVNDSVT